MADENDEPAYEVGYKRPPKNGQFKRGIADIGAVGRKDQKGFQTIVRESLAEQVVIKIDGRTRKLSLGEAILMRTLREGAGGNRRAAELSLRLMERYAPQKDEQPYINLDEFSLEEVDEFWRLLSKGLGQTEEWEAEQREMDERKDAHDRLLRIGRHASKEED